MVVATGVRRPVSSCVAAVLVPFLLVLSPARGDDEPNWKTLEKAAAASFQNEDVGRLRSLVHQIGVHDTPRAAELLIKYTLSGLDFDLEMEAGTALASMKSTAARQIIYREALRNKNFKTRVVLLGVTYYQREDPGAFGVLVKALRDRKKQVVFAAIRWLGKAGDSGAIEALIDALALREKRRMGRIYHDLRATLRSLTNQDFHVAADWKNYWEARQQGIVARSVTGKGRTKVASQKFFTVSLDSDRVVFVIDVSLSMERKDPLPEKVATTKRRGRTFVAPKKRKVKKKVDPATLPITRQRLYRVKRELIRTIESLPESVFFTIESFSSSIKFLGGSPTLLQATEANKRKGIGWVESMVVEGETHTDTAFEQAFERIEGMDTVIFLSDGAPRRQNRPIPEEDVLRSIRVANRFAKCRIHAIDFKRSGSNLRRFLAKLATEHDGKFTLLE